MPHKPGGVNTRQEVHLRPVSKRVPWIPLIKRESNAGCDDALGGSDNNMLVFVVSCAMEQRHHHKLWNRLPSDVGYGAQLPAIQR